MLIANVLVTQRMFVMPNLVTLQGIPNTQGDLVFPTNLLLVAELLVVKPSTMPLPHLGMRLAHYLTLEMTSKFHLMGMGLTSHQPNTNT